MQKIPERPGRGWKQVTWSGAGAGQRAMSPHPRDRPVDGIALLAQSPAMNDFSSQITRLPRPFDKTRGHEIDQLYGDQDRAIRQLLAGAGGSSPYLHGLLHSEADWLRAALAGAPDDVLDKLLTSAAGLDGKALGPGLRQAKRRVALFTALADLAGVWPLETVTGALTRFADLAVDLAVRQLVSAEIDRGKVPGAGAADKDDAAGMVVLAMGKMGAHELNYSSDIDLICLFDETRFDPSDYAEARAAFVRVTRRMCALIGEPTGEGYVFRTDLRLRPDAAVTPVCLSMETAERYYESVGRTWERAAYIKARPCAGALASGHEFLKRLTPFIWRKHLDFAAIQDAHDMRLRIREHKGLSGPMRLEGHDMKLGIGGIREIEFFTQTRQIIAGGRDPSLRVRATLKGLTRLAAKGWVPEDVAGQLSEDYVAHREVEHRLQMINDAQTHSLPKDAAGFERLAALCGRETGELRADIERRLKRVDRLIESFFAPDRKADVEPTLDAAAAEIIDRWHSYPSLRSGRAIEIFNRLKPGILSRLQKAARPDEALLQFDAFLSGLPAGVQVFSMFEANPQLVDMIIDIVSTAPQLAHYLGRNARVFDAVIAGDFFAPWPDVDWLTDDLSALLEEQRDYEDQLNTARRWQKEWHFRVGVHHLRGLIGAEEAGRQYAGLAEAVLRALVPVVADELARKHGEAPGRGAAVVGMGSLGAARLSASSDLDLIVIYDPQGVEQSAGRRPLPARSWYARFTQALVTALSAPMAEGRLYEVDMRLRPSGRQGPVATSLEAFRAYQETEAWTWEHLALTRARIMAGPPDLGAEIEAFRRDLLGRSRDAEKTLSDVGDMRARLADEKPAAGVWDVKNGAGGAQDIALLAETAALLAGDPGRDTNGQLAAGERIGWFDRRACDELCAASQLYWRVQAAARLLSGAAIELDKIGRGGADFLLRETGFASIEALEKRLGETRNRVAGLITATLGRRPGLL